MDPSFFYLGGGSNRGKGYNTSVFLPSFPFFSYHHSSCTIPWEILGGSLGASFEQKCWVPVYLKCNKGTDPFGNLGILRKLCFARDKHQQQRSGAPKGLTSKSQQGPPQLLTVLFSLTHSQPPKYLYWNTLVFLFLLLLFPIVALINLAHIYPIEM